jgi:uncharacterized protein YegL
MRRLPVYLVIDTSGSMTGEPIEAVKNGIQMLISTLRQDPYALETAYISIITFDSSAKQIAPLTELATFQIPSIQATGTTAMGEALSLLADRVDNEVQKTTSDVKGDWKPLVFLMTDGCPTDNLKAGIDRLRQTKTGMIIACAAGQGADEQKLKEITEIVVKLDTADSNTIKAFFKWVSASISTGSQKVDNGQKEVIGLNDLPPPPPEVNIVL